MSDRAQIQPPRSLNSLLSPPMWALKDVWDNFRTKRRERKTQNGRKNTKSHEATKPMTKSAGSTPTPPSTAEVSGVTAAASTPTHAPTPGDANASSEVEDKATAVSERDATVELREMLESNLGHLNQPAE